MKVAVVGTGYVGLVVGACLAETGNNVVCADINQGKIDNLEQNRIPMYEPGIEPLVVKNQRQKRLSFTTDIGQAVRESEVIFIAVGTPPDEDGSADLEHVLDVAHVIGKNMNSEKVIVTKSTVPVGTALKVRAAIEEHTSQRFHVCSNPEFLKEGAAVNDFMKPDRVIVGTDSDEATEILAELFAPFVRTGNPLIIMDVASAELTKYAANSMLATRISFMNQMAELCERVGANASLVRKGIGSDKRIGPAFLFPGPGYGGSCFPKDVNALIRTADDSDVSLDILKSVEEVNKRQKKVLFRKLKATFGDDTAGRTVAVWGLAFKAETDDMRESPSIDLIEACLNEGWTVNAHDPEANETARGIFGTAVNYFDDMYEALDGADALVIVTEWLQFRNPDFPRIKECLKSPCIIDGRNLFKPSRMKARGFTYVGIGWAER